MEINDGTWKLSLRENRTIPNLLSDRNDLAVLNYALAKSFRERETVQIELRVTYRVQKHGDLPIQCSLAEPANQYASFSRNEPVRKNMGWKNAQERDRIDYVHLPCRTRFYRFI
ncbi:hypothetical protein ACVWW1_006949 [Bradyrhizobium sp. JR3.5]